MLSGNQIARLDIYYLEIIKTDNLMNIDPVSKIRLNFQGLLFVRWKSTWAVNFQNPAIFRPKKGQKGRFGLKGEGYPNIGMWYHVGKDFWYWNRIW